MRDLGLWILITEDRLGSPVVRPKKKLPPRQQNQSSNHRGQAGMTQSVNFAGLFEIVKRRGEGV
jgi:hypothetical protein